MQAGGCGHPLLRGFQDISGRRGRRPLRGYLNQQLSAKFKFSNPFGYIPPQQYNKNRQKFPTVYSVGNNVIYVIISAVCPADHA